MKSCNFYTTTQAEHFAANNSTHPPSIVRPFHSNQLNLRNKKHKDERKKNQRLSLSL